MQKKTRKWVEIFVNLLFTGCILVFLYFLFAVFIFSSFKIPSDSMEPELVPGDYILVCKPVIGARLFDIFSALRNEQVEIYRMPGFKKIKHNDVIVFNFPYPNNRNRLEMHMMRYYIKRCVGLPGDTLQIINGVYRVNNIRHALGDITSQLELSSKAKDSFDKGVYNTYPYDTILNWNIHHFGPLYIPQQNSIIEMNRTNYSLYKKIIEWEQNAYLTNKDDKYYLNDQPIEFYQFKKNYYFVAGEQTENSGDSRYWGVLPEEFIVGKAWIVWKSINPISEKFRWDRFLKKIN